jgi:hypothetical protein
MSKAITTPEEVIQRLKDGKPVYFKLEKSYAKVITASISRNEMLVQTERGNWNVDANGLAPFSLLPYLQLKVLFRSKPKK